MEKEILKKNVSINADGSVIYNFGKKRAVPNSEELLKDSIWKDRLLNKWIYMRDEDRSVNTFIKHLFSKNRLLQVIYSGEDVYCDGVYKLYKVKISYFGDNDIFIDPQEFSSVYSSFTFPQGTSYIDQLLADGYISETERSIFLDKMKSDMFARALYRMKDDF